MLFPGPFQVLLPGDWILVVGTRDQIHRFRDWIKETRIETEEQKWEVGI
jgi:K+/H+ antiporter YhaU regulatory subunit KhtT